MTFTTILVCLWAIGLEIALRKREKSLRALTRAVNAVAAGKAKLGRNGERTTINYHKEK